MDFALQAALMGAVMGSAVLAVTTLYGWTLPAAPQAYGWWAAAFVLEAASKGALLSGDLPVLVDTSDILNGLAAGLSLCGAISFLGGRLTPGLMVSGLAAAMAWAVIAHMIRPPLHLAALPVSGIGGIPLLLGAWGFLTHGGPGRHSGANRLAALAFGGAALHQLAAPLLHSHPTLATWSFITSQFLSMVMAVALLVVVLRRQQSLAESEGQRANLLQSRLVDALGSVHDAVALFDLNDRLVTCNDLYREFLAPAAASIHTGCSFEDILKAEAEHGVVPDALGRERDWVFDMLADHAGANGSGREFQLWDGRWVAVNVYRTADGGHLRILRDVTSRRQTEGSLQESLNWLRGIMDTVVDGIVTIDDSGTVLSFNPSAARIFGYEANEVVGRNVSMLMPEPHRSAHDSYLRRYADTGEARVVGIGRQVKGRRKGGEEFPLDLAVTEMRQGDMVTFIGVVRDITDRKRVEDALVESEQRFRDLAESASDWFWEMDAEFQFTFVSGRVRQVLGVGPSFFIGRQFMELGEAGEAQEDWNQQLSLMRAHRPFRGFVFSHHLASGAVRFVEMAGRPAFDADGLFCGYRGTAADITPLKRHEKELAAQSAQRQAIIENLGQGVVVFDGTERLLALNHPARLLLDLPEPARGLEALETLEALLLHLALQGEFGRGNAMVKVSRRLGLLRRAPHQVFEHPRPNGMVLEVRSTAMPDGGLILTFTDITDRKKVEDTLREAKEAAERGNRAKATFLANISHELRTPLNAIIGFSELMKHEIFGPMEPPSYRSYVDDIHESGMHLLELINDILDMSKAEAGMTDLVDAVVDVTALIQSSMRMMIKRATANGVALIEQIATDLPYLRADERRLRQIVLNLVSNAVKFTDEGGTVTVIAENRPDGFVLRVSDTGIGMNADELERVMHPFVQADTRLSRKYEGTGLGLPLTKALVVAHGGTINLNSVPGQGTTVEVVFPPSRVTANGTGAIVAQEALHQG